MVAKGSVSEKTTINRLTSSISYVLLLLLVAGMIGYNASIYNNAKELANLERKTSRDFHAKLVVTPSDTLAIANFVLLSCLALIAILGLLSMINTTDLITSGNIYTLINSILGVVILICIGLIVLGSLAAHACVRAREFNIPNEIAGVYTDLTIISFVSGFIPLIAILISYFLQRYYL